MSASAAMARVEAAGVVTHADMVQLSEGGVPVEKILASYLYIPADAVSALVAKGEVSSETFFKALLAH